MKHKQRCEQQKQQVLEIQKKFNFFGKNTLTKNPINFRIIATFETDNEFDNSSSVDKTTNIY